MSRRWFTVCRLLAHWTTGAVMGSILTVGHWNNHATFFLIMHIVVQLVAIPINPYKKKNERP